MIWRIFMATNSISIQRVVGMAQTAIVNLLDGPMRLFSDFSATAEMLRLIQNVQKITQIFVKNVPLERIADGVSGIVGFIDARDIIPCTHDLVSGAAAQKDPLGPNMPNILNVARTVCTLVQDAMSVTRWLVSIKVLGEWITKSTARIALWGRSFVVFDGICDTAAIVGAIFGIADSARLIASESQQGGYWSKGKYTPSRLVGRCLDIANNICTIASSVLSNIPGVPLVYACVSSAIGSIVSLGKFFKEQYLDEVPIAATATLYIQ
jgi:hypothetical protein